MNARSVTIRMLCVCSTMLFASACSRSAAKPPPTKLNLPDVSSEARKRCGVSYQNVEDVRTGLLRAQGEIVACDKRRALAVRHIDSLRRNFKR